MASEHLIYEHDQLLPDRFDIPLRRGVSVDTIRTLHALIRAMQDREMVVIVRAMLDTEDGYGDRLSFSTHPDNVALIDEPTTKGEDKV